jgi:hypothetical protein
MAMKSTPRVRFAMLALAGLGLLPGIGCDPIHEPWLRSPDQLQAERARPEEAQVSLQHRLRAVQTDR